MPTTIGRVVAWPRKRYVQHLTDVCRALREHHDPIRQDERLRDVVRDQHGGEAGLLPQLLELLLQHPSGEGVQRTERLVEQQSRRGVDQGAGQGGALGHTTGDLRRIRVREVRQADEIEDLVDPRPGGFQNASRLRPDRNVFPDRAPGQQRGVLKDEGAARIGTLHSLAVDVDLAEQRGVEPGEQPDEGRFAGTAGADQGDELAWLRRDRHIVEDEQILPVTAEGLGDVDDVDRRAGGRGPRGLRLRHHLVSSFSQRSTRLRAQNSRVSSSAQMTASTMSPP